MADLITHKEFWTVYISRFKRRWKLWKIHDHSIFTFSRLRLVVSKRCVDISVKRIKLETYHLEIFTDARTTGRSAACGKEIFSGQWNEVKLSLHINDSEILAAHFSFKVFAKTPYDCQILLRVDNTITNLIHKPHGWYSVPSPHASH